MDKFIVKDNNQIQILLTQIPCKKNKSNRKWKNNLAKINRNLLLFLHTFDFTQCVFFNSSMNDEWLVMIGGERLNVQ